MKKNKQMLTVIIFLILITAISTSMNSALESNNLIRLHVIANSDSPKDQALKYKVRDQLLLSFGDELNNAKTINDARNLINANLDKFKEIASKEVKKQGYEYPVEASLGVSRFPTRVYGDLVYPAGDYEALRLVIGEGSGANWWCVMFPPLCFVDVSSGVVSEGEMDEDIPGESEKNVTTDQDDKTIVYTFKLAQWWNSFRDWISGLFA
ncbi:MAG: stage II sporulation protein R [Clostridia bacterium]|nr:stage II sporulation protein R [Clostridia bacterium]MDD4681369.1 stage II sporulation protein R [Clostridia bacterium]